VSKKDPSATLFERVWYFIAKNATRIIWHLVYRVRIAGREHIPKEGSALVVANHQSHFDPPCIGSSIPRQSNFFARKTLFDHKIFGAAIHALGAVPIDQEGSAISGVKETLRRLKKGGIVVVFPEGARTPDGEMKEFLPGFATLAVRSKSPIVPAAIAGAYECFPRGQKWPGFGRLAVVFGEPIPAEVVCELDEEALMAEVRARVEACFEEAVKLRGR
jgi:1-acyl-sn-glycerol-3-phosphate acyltransferase